MSDSQPQPTFEGDRLGRQRVAETIHRCAIALAEDSTLDTGRVIAVNARWGAGKSWVAKRLEGHLKTAKGVGRLVLIDAFEFDFHHDPFSVITSAILNKSELKSKVANQLKQSAKEVIKATLPGVAAATARFAAGAVGLDLDAATEAAKTTTKAIDIGEKALAKMLDSFAATKASIQSFKTRLGEFAKESDGALVVVVDELDRCRPSFALETLERIKHLFDVPGVVFVLFMHDKALHAAISHMYGDGINPHEYLRKFITVSIDLPSALDDQPEAASRFVDEFLSQSAVALNGGAQSDRSFRDFLRALGELAPRLGATLRDIEQAVLLWRLTRGDRKVEADMLALAALVRVTDGQLFGRLLLEEPQAYEQLASRLLGTSGPGEVTHLVRYIWAALKYCVEPLKYVNSDEGQSPEVQLVRTYLQGDPSRNGGYVNRHLSLALNQLKLVGLRL